MARFNVATLLAIFVFCFVSATIVAEGKRKSRYRCPDGYLNEGMNCVMKVYEEPKVTCKHGHLHQGQCVKYVKAQPSCPPGYALSKSAHAIKYRQLKKLKHAHKIPPQCVNVTKVSPVPFCPPSYVLEGDKCFRLDTRPPICPPGTSDVGQHCVSHTPAVKECPSGFMESMHKHKHAKDGQCSRKNMVDAFEVCPPGFENIHGKCIKKTMAPLVCPHGTDDIGEMCATYGKVSRRCPPGFDLNAVSECEKHISIKAEVYCEEGYDLVKGSCIKTVSVTPTCPHGTKDVGGRCASYSHPTPVCPSGFSLSKGHSGKYSHGKYHSGKHSQKSICIKKLEADMFPICNDPESMLESDLCMKSIYRPPVCPHGTVSSGEGCVSYKTAKSQCPDGFTLKRSSKKHKVEATKYKCIKVISLDATPVCSEGFVLVGNKCEQVCSVPATAMCTKGVRQNEECVEYSLCQPQYTCTDGFEYIGHKRCAKEITQQCQKLDYETRCYEVPECFEEDECSYAYDKFHKDHHHNRKLTSCHGSSCKKDYYVPKNHLKKGELCETVAVEKSDLCSETLEADAMMICPDGSLTDKGQCRIAQYSDVSYVCSEGRLDSSHSCVSKKFEKPSFVCPDGFKLARNNTCIAVNKAKLDYYCNEGDLVEGHKCASYVPKECLGGSCETQVKNDAKFICPEGYSPSGHKTCTATEVVDVSLTCHFGELVGHKCVEYSQKECAGGSCEILAKSAPKHQCAEGFTASFAFKKPKKSFKGGHDKKCNVIETLPSEPFCKKGTLIEGNRCATYVNKSCLNGKCEIITTVKPDHECPEHYFPDGHHSNTCYSMEFAPHDIFCTDGELAEEGCRCAKYESKVCPPGGCEVTSEIKPLFDCPPGFNSTKSKHGLQCQTIDVVDVQYNCSSGYKSDCNMCEATFKPEALKCQSQIAEIEHVSGKCSYKKFSVPNLHEDDYF